MNNLLIFTKLPFTKENGSKQLKDHFKKFKIINDLDIEIFMGIYPNNFSLQLNSKENRFNSIEPKEDIDDIVKHISNKDSIFTELLYNKVIIAKEVINVLLDIYPELYIHDCDFLWYGTAEEYIKSHHMDKDLGFRTPDLKIKNSK